MVSISFNVSGKGRDEYLIDEVVQPKKVGPKYRSWKIENNLVISWLLSSMTNEIGENFFLYETTAKIREATKIS